MTRQERADYTRRSLTRKVKEAIGLVRMIAYSLEKSASTIESYATRITLPGAGEKPEEVLGYVINHLTSNIIPNCQSSQLMDVAVSIGRMQAELQTLEEVEEP